MNKQLRLEIKSRTGRFNLLGDEVSISYNICVYENDEAIMSTNLTLDHEENPGTAFAENAIYLLEECLEHMFIDTTRDEKKKLLAFIKKNREGLDFGSKQFRIKALKSQIKYLREQN